MKKILFEDRLKGGVDVANLKKYLNRFDPSEVELGKKVEKEHTKDPDLAAEIASDHLSEDPHYYSKLKKSGIKGESVDVFEFNFFDILEVDYKKSAQDIPLGMLVQKNYEPPKVTGKEVRKTARLDQRDKLSAALSKMGASPEYIETSLKTFDATKDKGGRPATGDSNKHRLGIYGHRGQPRKDQGLGPGPKALPQPTVSVPEKPKTKPKPNQWVTVTRKTAADPKVASLAAKLQKQVYGK